MAANIDPRAASGRGWTAWGDKVGEGYRPAWSTCGHNSATMDGPDRA